MNTVAINQVVHHVRTHRIGSHDAEFCRAVYCNQQPSPRYEGSLVRGYAARSYLDHTSLVPQVLSRMGHQLSAGEGMRVVLVGGGSCPELVGLWEHWGAALRPQRLDCVNLDGHVDGWAPLARVTRKILDHLGAPGWRVHHRPADFRAGSALAAVTESSGVGLAVQQFMANELGPVQRAQHYRRLAGWLASGNLRSALLIEPSGYKHAEDLFSLRVIPGVETVATLVNAKLPTHYGACPHPGLSHCTSVGYSGFRRKYRVHAVLLKGATK